MSLHQFPPSAFFPLVDRVIAIEADRARLLRMVTRNDSLLRGYPTMPPTLVVEALAQAAALLVARAPAGRSLLVGIDEFTFRAPVRVGEQLLLEVERRAGGGRVHRIAGRALVGGEVRAEGTLMLSQEAVSRSV